ncbi:MAG TPA: beta-ketoacyl synthase N-terminal-like domain-containing protein, partial [Pseudomonadales bacterium]|nr:beta-ketoacyl synthase N-terminal-like domain-containing protein [Pseudomonadales bacterium]
MSEAFIIDAVRTPRGIGKPGKGALSGMHPQHLAATVLKALQERNGLNTADVDDVIWGTSAQKGGQGGDLGRMAALDAGFDIRVSGVTLDRFCGSGLTATNLAAAQIMSGMEDLLIAGGTEMMSLITALGQQEMAAGLRPAGGIGSGNARLQLRHPQSHQGLCADAIASMEGFDRATLDAFALESQRRAAVAIREGRFDRSIVPVIDDEGKVVLASDEHPRPQTTAQELAALKPSFAQIADMAPGADGVTFRQLINRRYPDLKIEHFHHAGNSSGVVDGAAALLLA